MMVTMKLITLVAFVFSLFVQNSLCLSEAQLKSTGKLMRNTCQPKTKVTDEQIDGMHAGTWGFEKPAMCYVHCWMKMMKALTPDNKIDLEGARKQLLTLPEARLQPTLASFEKCAPQINGQEISDKCEIAYSFAKCFYDSNPSNYFLP